MKPKLPRGTLDRLWADPKNWRVGLIYVCKDDPRTVVPKRQKWRGWTVNFAHARAWPAMLGFALLVAVPVVVLAREGLVNTAIGVSVLAALLFVLVWLSWFLASPKRFED